MHRISPLHCCQFKNRTTQHRAHFPVLGAIIFTLLLTGIQFLPTSLFTSKALAFTAPKSVMRKVTLTIDGVTLNIDSAILPNGSFQTATPSDAVQMASIKSHNPYFSLDIIAVPYSTPSEAKQVLAGYYANIQFAWEQQTATPQKGTAITIFGQKIQGTVFHILAPTYSSKNVHVVVAEWEMVAGFRVWILRVMQEVSTNEAVTTKNVLAQLQGTVLTSTTLNHPSTVHQTLIPSHTLVTPFNADQTLGLPSWWNGQICDTNRYSGSYTLPKGGTPRQYNGVYACGPRPVADGAGDVATVTLPGGRPELEWECVELSKRWLNLAYGIPDSTNYAADGSGVVLNFPTSTDPNSPNSKIQRIVLPWAQQYIGDASIPNEGSSFTRSNNNIAGLPISAGDVLSFRNPHTSIITSISIDQNGNGSFQTMDQNVIGDGTIPSGYTYHVSNWVVQSSYVGDIVGWLHYTGGSSSTISQQDTFVTGANGHLYDYHWTLGNNWVTNDLGTPASGVLATGTPSANTFTSGGTQYQHVEVVGNNGHLYEYWQLVGGGWNINDLNSLATPPTGVTFVGSPNGFSYIASGNTYHSISLLGNNGHLYNYAWVSSNSGTWTLTDLNSTVTMPSGVTWTGTPSGDAFTSGSSQYQHIILLGNNGHLYEFWQFIGQNWNLNDLYTLTSPPAGVTFVGSPDSFSYIDGGQTFHSIFILGSDNHLYNDVWEGSTNAWALTDLIQQYSLPSGVTPTGTPNGNAFTINGTLDQHVEVIGSDGHVYEYWQTAGQLQGTWNGLNDLTTLASTSAVATGSPWGQSYVLQGQTTENHSIYVVTNDGHLQEFNWVWSSSGGTWSIIDHGIPASTTLSGSSPSATAY